MMMPMNELQEQATAYAGNAEKVAKIRGVPTCCFVPDVARRGKSRFLRAEKTVRNNNPGNATL